MIFKKKGVGAVLFASISNFIEMSVTAVWVSLATPKVSVPTVRLCYLGNYNMYSSSEQPRAGLPCWRFLNSLSDVNFCLLASITHAAS